MERADWVCSAAASSVACQGEMWTLRRLASERSMPTPRRSGRSDYRTCGVSVGWKASRSLLIVQLRRSNNVRLPCAVAASPQAVHVGDLGRRGADVSPVLNDFRHPLSLIYSLAPTYDPSRWTMLKARPAEPKYTLAKGQSGRGLLAPARVRMACPRGDQSMRVFAPAIMVSGILLGAGVASAAPGDFGGRWAVRMVTEAGVCDASYNYLIAVDDGGRVRYIPQDSDAPPSVSGSVGPSGAVNLDIRKSIARVSATGQLNGTSGSGSWRLPGLCSGRWTASKRGSVQAAR
jgi:hypothetical protein